MAYIPYRVHPSAAHVGAATGLRWRDGGVPARPAIPSSSYVPARSLVAGFAERGQARRAAGGTEVLAGAQRSGRLPVGVGQAGTVAPAPCRQADERTRSHSPLRAAPPSRCLHPHLVAAAIAYSSAAVWLSLSYPSWAERRSAVGGRGVLAAEHARQPNASKRFPSRVAQSWHKIFRNDDERPGPTLRVKPFWASRTELTSHSPVSCCLRTAVAVTLIFVGAARGTRPGTGRAPPPGVWRPGSVRGVALADLLLPAVRGGRPAAEGDGEEEEEEPDGEGCDQHD
jgi:hypothetical protein